MTKRIIAQSALLFSLALAACGGTPAPTPETPATASAEPAKPDAPATSPSEPAAESPAAASEPAPAEASSRPTRSPIDTITAPKLAFILNYASSAPQQAAEKKCQAAKDPQARADCMQKERSDFLADVIQFKKDTQGKLWWIIYRRKGANLTELSKNEIQLGDETENTVSASIVGSDKKPRVLFSAKNKFKIAVPNDYSLELDEPRYGKLVYDAKIDIVGE